MTETTVISLKGKIHEYGPSLEHAPEGAVYIGRAAYMGGWRLPHSKWRNPFKAQQYGSAAKAVEAYERWLDEPGHAALRARIVPELAGKTLLCWCNVEAGAHCHGLVLARRSQEPLDARLDRLLDAIEHCDFGEQSGDCREPDMPVRPFVDIVVPAGEWAGAL